MKLKLIIILLSCFAINAQAGFVVKRAAATIVVTEAQGGTAKQSSHTVSKAQQLLITLRSFLPHDRYNERHWKKFDYHEKTGWPGITSAICSGASLLLIILGFCGIFGAFTLAFIPLSVLGFVFGIVGVTKNHKYKGLALAGLILGFVEMLFSALVIALALALAGAGI